MIAPPRPALADRPAPPPVWGWYVAFCVAWALFYALAIAFSAWLLVTGEPPPPVTTASVVAMGLWFGFCAVLLVAYAIAHYFTLLIFEGLDLSLCLIGEFLEIANRERAEIHLRGRGFCLGHGFSGATGKPL